MAGMATARTARGEKLETFWRAISREGSFSITSAQQEVLDRFMSFWLWPGMLGKETMTKLFPMAPWFNPGGHCAAHKPL